MEEMTYGYKIGHPDEYLKTLPVDEDRLKTSRQFVYDVLRHYTRPEAEEIIDTELKAHFTLSPDEIKNLKQYYKGMKKVSFKEIGDRILQNSSSFTLRDTQEVCFYKDGVYNIDKSQTHIKQLIRTESLVFKHLPNRAFVDETFAYIQAHSYEDRDKVDAGNYINFNNGLFNLDTWELEPHNPKYLSIR